MQSGSKDAAPAPSSKPSAAPAPDAQAKARKPVAKQPPVPSMALMKQVCAPNLPLLFVCRGPRCHVAMCLSRRATTCSSATGLQECAGSGAGRRGSGCSQATGTAGAGSTRRQRSCAERCHAARCNGCGCRDVATDSCSSQPAHFDRWGSLLLQPEARRKRILL